MIDYKDNNFMQSAFNTGAFVVSGDNPMVASWGFVGTMWGKKVFVTPIRDSRYTKTFIDETKVFTVSVPESGTMKNELAFCGTKSGRDFDKWKETGMTKIKAKIVDTVVVGGCKKYFECKVIATIPSDNIDLSAVEKWYPTSEKYPEGDRHTFYFGEIVGEY